MRNVAFVPRAFEEFNSWATEDKKIYGRITGLIKDILRDPFVGIGKPEPLKHQAKGMWSRRITEEHRLVYEVREAQIVIHSCRFHYKK